MACTRFRPVVVLALLIASVWLVAGCSGGDSTRHAGSAPAAPLKGGADFNGNAPEAPPPPVEPARDVVKTASLILVAADPAAAADKATAIVDKAGGRVDERSDDAGSTSGRASVHLMLRVPANGLDAALASLKGLGTVQTLEVKTDDVTTRRVDLDARITALKTSVDRLLAIMRDAKDPDALIKAEDALSSRQAELQSLQAQRDTLRDQITYSSVDVQITAERTGGPAPERYHGFLGQVERGWDALWAFGSHLVLAFGFLLPWLLPLAVLGGALYVFVKWTGARHKRSGSAEPAPPVSPPQE
ncbi:DUF4349 domain-containing protein [Mycolicibacterium aubagnense]|uniref:DUF4349 domain-containing protein n=1 Tax=Mycolicibacterium aubagnense TaxID=319707 RepID=A0ABN5YY16_9MYCO|nr:DUF4349 domain-containing protein [Mycolicibacterium aubagnense]TLH70805.1 DUF4349 domain-containing protein [Mycolicibacterium aubagnense]WGI32712.1 DUF4349 domain-containing protein [Mycolicibacterium aubagnense]BBX85664.1 hypothetical protein MAUB_35370 [Mycolicibacterium aubagnense]